MLGEYEILVTNELKEELVYQFSVPKAKLGSLRNSTILIVFSRLKFGSSLGNLLEFPYKEANHFMKEVQDCYEAQINDFTIKKHKSVHKNGYFVIHPDQKLFEHLKEENNTLRIKLKTGKVSGQMHNIDNSSSVVCVFSGSQRSKEVSL